MEETMAREFYTKEEKQNHIALWGNPAECSKGICHEQQNKRGDILQVDGKNQQTRRQGKCRKNLWK